MGELSVGESSGHERAWPLLLPFPPPLLPLLPSAAPLSIAAAAATREKKRTSLTTAFLIYNLETYSFEIGDIFNTSIVF